MKDDIVDRIDAHLAEIESAVIRDFEPDSEPLLRECRAEIIAARDRRWIPASERLPDSEDEDGGIPNVLGYYPDYPPDIQLVWYTGNGWEDGDGSGRDVKPPAYWMPLPEPPRAMP